MEHSKVEFLSLNEIARVVVTTAKTIFFDPYQKNKSCGAFILIDPITNNTSAVGMIIDRVEKDSLTSHDTTPTINLSQLGIAAEHYQAIEKVAKELDKLGVTINIVK